MHFMQPGSTTIPYFATSACTRTLLVQVAVQWPQPSHASVTRIRRRGSIDAPRLLRTAVGAEAFRAEHVHDQKAVDQDRQRGHPRAWKRGPKRLRPEVRAPRSRRMPGEQSRELGPDEHVERGAERNEREQSRAHQSRAHPDLREQPGAKVLVRDDVARPAAEEAPEDQRGEDRDREEQEARVHVAELERLHRLRRALLLARTGRSAECLLRWQCLRRFRRRWGLYGKKRAVYSADRSRLSRRLGRAATPSLRWRPSRRMRASFSTSNMLRSAFLQP
jgi:hypothetical protein